LKRFIGIFVAVMFSMTMAACGGDEANPDALGDLGDNGFVDVDANADVTDDADASRDDIQVDTPDDTQEVLQELPDNDIPDDEGVEVEMETRHFTFKAIAGMSMGAAALTVASHYPELFDSVGALGGYVDYRYIGRLMKDMMGSGFCPMEQLLRPDVLEDINNPDNPLVFCGNNTHLRPHEFYWDFNHFHYDDDGGTWDRKNYFQVLSSLVYAFGNFMFYNEDNPLLPPGVDVDWLNEPDKCNNPAVVEYPYNINAEYNPKGEYNLISFCDGETKVGCDESDPPKCGSKHPQYRELVGRYDPTQNYDFPVFTFLAVDYNGNGKRDYGEPVVFNVSERWDDVGVDGCSNEFEDGNGGCLEESNGHPEIDANGDDFDLEKNPRGTEGNGEYDEGEPFEDFGIDGVPQEISGVKDYGEGNGVFDYNPRYEALINQDARTFFLTADVEELKKHSYYLEGGIRDMLHALTSAKHLAAALASRGLEVKYYEDFAGQPNSIFPEQVCDDIVNIETPEYLVNFDFSSGSFGENVLVGYGNPNLTEAELVNNNNGKHVGDACELLVRSGIFYTMAMSRMPDTIRFYSGDYFGATILYSSYYSEILQSRRWYGLNLPPGYFTDERLKDAELPLGIILPGIGMPLWETTEATRIVGLTQASGATPRFILLSPDGQCCFRNSQTGERFCNCYRISGGYQCVEAQCKGEHEECEEFVIPRDNMVQECNSGHFFVNQATNVWGETDLETARFEDALLEVIDVVSKKYRIKQPADVEVPVGF